MIPVTVLTGFLGSGKTTLINRLLREAHGRRFAVIENEFGEINVDAELLVREKDETVVQLTNGCICCTVRGDMANALSRLVQLREHEGRAQFDHVLIEPTGLADPGPIVRTFMAETEILSHFFLDGVVTLVDALHGERTLNESVEAQAQLAYADQVLITKADLISDPEVMKHLETVIGDINPTTKITPIDLTRAPWDEVFEKLLEQRGYQFDRVVAVPAQETTVHTEGVGSISFMSDSPLDGERFSQVLAAIDRRYGDQVWRIKGVLGISGMRNRIVVQGVQGLMQANPSTIWRAYEPQRSQLVLIGRNLDRDWVLRLLNACVIPSIKQSGMPKPEGERV